MEKILNAEEILMIKKTPIVRAYNSDKEGYKGKNYRIYAFGEKAFAVHEDEDFHKEFANGNLAKVMIVLNDEGQWSYANHNTFDQLIRVASKSAELEAVKLGAVKVKPVDEAQLNALG